LVYRITEVIVRDVEVVECLASYHLVIGCQDFDELADSQPNSFLIFLGNKIVIIWGYQKLSFCEDLAYFLQNI
jgi:hypothetical protein